jgi:hypothetical protein
VFTEEADVEAKGSLLVSEFMALQLSQHWRGKLNFTSGKK